MADKNWLVEFVDPSVVQNRHSTASGIEQELGLRVYPIEREKPDSLC
jgi:hypothetical protein